MMRIFVSAFPRKMLEDNQNPNSVRNFSLYNIRFLESSSKHSKNTGGGGVVKAVWKNPNKSRFFLGWLPLQRLYI